MRHVIAALAIFSIASCGPSKDEPKLSPQAVETINNLAEWGANLPKCADVWVGGKTLPKDYDGCKAGDTIIAGVSVGCGDVDIYTYEPDSGGGYFTDKDGVIHDGGDDYANDPLYMKDC